MACSASKAALVLLLLLATVDARRASSPAGLARALEAAARVGAQAADLDGHGLPADRHPLQRWRARSEVPAAARGGPAGLASGLFVPAPHDESDAVWVRPAASPRGGLGDGLPLLPEGGIAVSINTTTLERSGSVVEVSWSGVPSPSYDDVIALYVPGDVDARLQAPVKYSWAARAAGHLREGSGSLRFRVLNYRQPAAFALVRGGLAWPRPVAWSDLLVPSEPNEPLQGHLSLTGRPGEMLVQWTQGADPVALRGDRAAAGGGAAASPATESFLDGLRSASAPAVRYGPVAGGAVGAAAAASLPLLARGETTTYGRSDMCGQPANGSGWLDPGLLRSAVLSGLEPGAEYAYAYGDEELDLWSTIATFRAAPEVGVGPDSAVSFLALADLGQAEEDGSLEASEMTASLATARAIEAERAREPSSLLVLNGDVSYARGYGALWERFFDLFEPTLRAQPLMTVVGNHERDWPGSGDRFPVPAGPADFAVRDSGGECGVPYYRRTLMPTPAEDSPWYSLDFGPIHFLQYSTEHAFEAGSPQHDFILRDLAGVDRARTPWLVVGGHRPMYVDSTFTEARVDGDQYFASRLRDALEPLFAAHGVDVTWHGHHHSYQRTCPVLNGSCVDTSAPVSSSAASSSAASSSAASSSAASSSATSCAASTTAASSAGGAPVHLVIGHSGAGLTPNVRWWRPKIFSVVRLRHGYVRVRANATHLEHEVIGTFDGQVMDRLVLEREPRAPAFGRSDAPARPTGLADSR